jgi:hypothetical protein
MGLRELGGAKLTQSSASRFTLNAREEAIRREA